MKSLVNASIIILSITCFACTSNRNKVKGGRNPIGYLNVSRKEFSFDVYPKESVNIKPQYNTPVAHATIIWANGQSVGVIEQNGVMFTRTNQTSAIIKYKLVNNALDGDDTYPSNVLMIKELPGFGKIGWAENYSMNYEDATVEVTILPPLSHPPGPFPRDHEKPH